MIFKRINLHSIESAVAAAVAAAATQFIAEPFLDLDTANWKKLASSGILGLVVYLKGRAGKFIGDPNSPAWIPKEAPPAPPVVIPGETDMPKD